jgi:protease I
MKTPNLKGLRVAILAADGVEQSELTSPLKSLQKAGAAVEVIAPHKGKIQAVQLLKPGKRIPVDRVIDEADADLYDALLLPGGHISPDTLRKNEAALQFVRAVDAAGKPIAVICHGPWVLVSAGLVHGRRLAAWPSIADDIQNAGGTWEDSAVVEDGNWISSRGPQDLAAFNKAVLSHFATVQPMRPHAEVRPRKRRGLGWILGGILAAGVGYAYNRIRTRQVMHPGMPTPGGSNPA